MQISISILISTLIASLEAQKYMINCFYGSWASKTLKPQLLPQGINPNLCTHITYAFFELTGSGRVNRHEHEYATLAAFSKLKSNKGKPKLIAAIGGPSVKAEQFTAIAADEEARTQLVTSVAMLLRDYSFDGADLHWYFPGRRFHNEDKENFVTLLRDLKAELNENGYISGVTVSGEVEYAARWYNVSQISPNVDFINVMAYNYTSSIFPVFLAPLFGETSHVEASMNFWIAHGAPAGKLNLGVALIGRSFKIKILKPELRTTTSGPLEKTTMAPVKETTMAPVKKTTLAPNVTTTPFPRFNTFTQMCIRGKNKSAHYHYIPRVETAFMIEGNVLTGFENDQSLGAKMGFVKKHSLGGVMIWSLENEDFLGRCGLKFRILRLINTLLK
ncbi:chitinase-3-like protein 1 [Stomoxys calcitrans]|uniref:chitinase-3-like protein 1 n=1 Tax=Stomoxys calcitrans TaxID=35570 RepID=UPI0027E2819A|nr:chitinase-3-like protein 1 [Stomoxys calcitrans]